MASKLGEMVVIFVGQEEPPGPEFSGQKMPLDVPDHPYTVVYQYDIEYESVGTLIALAHNIEEVVGINIVSGGLMKGVTGK